MRRISCISICIVWCLLIVQSNIFINADSDEIIKSCNLPANDDDDVKERNNYGSTLFSHIAGENWLKPPISEVNEYYNVAKIQCNKELELYRAQFETISKKGLPPIYSTEYEYKTPQNKCRGNDLLFYVSGMMVYPFGPTDKVCTLYSTCWYGLLACGTPDYSQVKSEDVIKEYIKSKVPPRIYNETITIPKLSHNFNISSIYVHQRIVGDEIIVPDTRFFICSIIYFFYLLSHTHIIQIVAIR